VRIEAEEFMKIAMVILFLMSTACAQTIKPDELLCGSAILTLSMSQARTVQILKDNGYTLVNTGKAGDTNLPIEIWVNGVEGRLCQISFGDSKLVYVNRHWKPRNDDARNAVEAVINAIQSVTEPQNHSACDVFSYTSTKPTGTHKAVDVMCGGHKIELSVIDTNQLRTFDIEESIGSFLKKP
jgi:hypothetical protein